MRNQFQTNLERGRVFLIQISHFISGYRGGIPSLITVLAALLIVSSSQAQNVGIGTKAPNPNAILDITVPDPSVQPMGLLVPRLTTAQRNDLGTILTPADYGLLVYDTDEGIFFYFNVDGWNEGLGAFNRTAAGGDLVGQYPNPSIADNVINSANIQNGAVTTDKLVNSAVTTSKIDNDAVTTIKIADAAVTFSKLEDAGVTAGTYGSPIEVVQVTVDQKGRVTAINPLTISLTGAEIQDGTIENADIASDAITTDKIADGTIATADVADGAITTAKILDGTIITTDIADDAVTIAKIGTAGAADGDKVLTTDAAGNPVWADRTDFTTSTLSDGSIYVGDVNDIAQEVPVSGDVTIDNTGNVQIVANAVGSAEIANDAVGSTEIATDAVGSSEIATDAVGSAEIASGAVGTDEIADGAVGSADIGTDAVGADEIAADAVGSSEIATDAVGSAEIAADAVTSSEIATDAVTASEIASGAVGSDEIATDAVTSAEIAADAVGADEIASGAVGTDEIATDAVTAAEIASGAVGSDEIATDAVGSAEIAADAVTASEIAADAVGSSEIIDESIAAIDIAADAVTASEIATDAVGADEIATGAVGADEIATDAVGSAEIAADAVTASEIAAGAVTTSEILDGTVSTADIGDDQVTLAKIENGGANQFLTTDATGNPQYENQSDVIDSFGGEGLVGDGAGALDVNVDNSTLEVVSDVVQVRDAGITTAKIADEAVTVDKIKGNVTGVNNRAVLITDNDSDFDGDREAEWFAPGASKVLITQADGSISSEDRTNFATNTLNEGNIFIGNASNQATELNAKVDGRILVGNGTTLGSVPITGDISLTNTGVTDINTGVVGSNEIATDAVTASEIAAGAVGNSEIAANAVTTTEMGTAGVADANKIYTTDASGNPQLEDRTNFVSSNLTEGSIYIGNTLGEATAVDASTDGAMLIGDGTTVNSVDISGDIDIDNTGDAQIQADAVTAAEIAADAVGSSEIAIDAVGSAEIAADAVGSAEIAAGAVGTSEIAADAVTTTELGTAGAADADKVYTTDASGNPQLEDRTNFTSSTLAQGSVYVGDATGVAAAVDASTDGFMLIGDGTTVNSVDISGDINIDNTGDAQIQVDAVTAAEIAADAVTASEIAADAVTASEIATDAVGASEISASAVGVSEISTAIAGNGLTGGGGSALSVQADGAEIAVGAAGITIAQQGATNGQVLKWNGTDWAPSTDDVSDERFKRDIEEIPGALAALEQVRGVNYTFRTEEFPERDFTEEKQYGVIAQEVQKVFPELVHEDKEGYLSVNYTGLIPVLLQALKEQQQIINQLRAALNDEHRNNEELKAALDRQQDLYQLQSQVMLQMQEENASMQTDLDMIKKALGLDKEAKIDED